MDSYGYKFLFALRQHMQNAVTELYGPLMESFSGFALLIAGLWVAVVGYLFIKGKLKEQGPSFLVSAAIVMVIAGIVFTPRTFANWIYFPIIELVTNLCAFIVAPNGGGGFHTLFTTLDARFEEVFGYIEALGDEGDAFNMMPIIFSLIMGLIFSILYAVFILFMAIGYFGMNVMLAFGGIFLFFGAFKSTRFLFSSWARALANYALVPVFTALVMSITLGSVQTAFADLAAQETTDLWSIQVANALLVGVLGIFFHLKASEFAASITGGQPAGMMGILAAAPMAAGALRGGVGALMNASGATKGMRHLGSKMAAGRDALASGALSGAANQITRAYSRMRGISN